MKVNEIVAIHQSLQALGNEKLGVSFEIAKNIKICNDIIKPSTEIAQTVHATYADKDEKGNIIEYKNEHGNSERRITDPVKLKLWATEAAKIESEEHDVTFVHIAKSKLDGKEINANLLVPLLGTVIFDE